MSPFYIQPDPRTRARNFRTPGKGWTPEQMSRCLLSFQLCDISFLMVFPEVTVRVSLCVCVYLCLSVRVSVRVSVRLSVCLSIRLFVSVSCSLGTCIASTTLSFRASHRGALPAMAIYVDCVHHTLLVRATSLCTSFVAPLTKVQKVQEISFHRISWTEPPCVCVQGCGSTMRPTLLLV
eukprot:COSAG01_NODE_1962_length_8790_cov_10.999540_9_plen_179_part_00